MRKTRLKPPTKATVRGITYWRVETPKPGGGRIRRHFRDKEDARIHFERAKVELARFGEAAMIDDRTRTDAARAAEILEGTGASILDAARFFRSHLDRTTGGRAIDAAVAEYLRAKESEGASLRHISTITHRLQRFANGHPDATTASVQTADIDAFLVSVGGSPQTRRGYRLALHAAFEWFRSRKYCVVNPVADAMNPRVTPDTPGILTPKQAAELLAGCDDAILTGVVLGMFCGLRQAEISRMDWRDIDLAGGHVVVGAGVAKTATRRTVTIPEAAKEWLAPHAKESGRVWPEGEQARNLWNLARIHAGFGPFSSTSAIVREAQAGRALRPWPDNALRHSAISYRVAIEGDLARIAYESGNSPGVIQRHYNGLAKPSAAKAFFEIRPVVNVGAWQNPDNVHQFPSGLNSGKNPDHTRMKKTA
jgi:integrase